jgi:putative toxin-antitoxin system antitoxin component (TIGR02293 family)
MPEGGKGRRKRSGAGDVMPEIRRQAIEVLGSEEAADEWLNEPAIALNWQRPVDLLPGSKKLVEDLLWRIEHGVYM